MTFPMNGFTFGFWLTFYGSLFGHLAPRPWLQLAMTGTNHCSWTSWLVFVHNQLPSVVYREEITNFGAFREHCRFSYVQSRTRTFVPSAADLRFVKTIVIVKWRMDLISVRDSSKSKTLVSGLAIRDLLHPRRSLRSISSQRRLEIAYSQGPCLITRDWEGLLGMHPMWMMMIKPQHVFLGFFIYVLFVVCFIYPTQLGEQWRLIGISETALHARIAWWL